MHVMPRCCVYTCCSIMLLFLGYSEAKCGITAALLRPGDYRLSALFDPSTWACSVQLAVGPTAVPGKCTLSQGTLLILLLFGRTLAAALQPAFCHSVQQTGLTSRGSHWTAGGLLRWRQAAPLGAKLKDVLLVQGRAPFDLQLGITCRKPQLTRCTSSLCGSAFRPRTATAYEVVRDPWNM